MATTLVNESALPLNIGLFALLKKHQSAANRVLGAMLCGTKRAKSRQSSKKLAEGDEYALFEKSVFLIRAVAARGLIFNTP